METPVLAQDEIPFLEGMKVLIVDDNQDLRETLEMFFDLMNAEVRLAASGQQALDEWQTWNPTAILCDLGMPELDGFEFMQALRKAEQQQGKARTPTIAVSAYSQEENRIRAAEVGFDAFVAKPAYPDHLAKMLIAMIRPAAS